MPAEHGPLTIAGVAFSSRLLVGTGFIDNVPPEVWAYEVSGKQVLRQWFSYRRRIRERPLIGDKRPPSLLGEIQPDHWLPEYTSELILFSLVPPGFAFKIESPSGTETTGQQLEISYYVRNATD